MLVYPKAITLFIHLVCSVLVHTHAYLSVYWRLEGIILFKINPFSFLIFAGINVCYVHVISDPPSIGDTFG